MNNLRRTLLRGVSASALLPLMGGGFLLPRQVLAAEWNKSAFTARNVGDALKAYGAGSAATTPDIAIQAPEIAENGAKVEVEITSNIPNTQSIALFADKNPMPLCAAIQFSGSILPFTRLQVKLAESTKIRAVVKTADGKTHIALRDVKVTAGGCGG